MLGGDRLSALRPPCLGGAEGAGAALFAGHGVAKGAATGGGEFRRGKELAAGITLGVRVCCGQFHLVADCNPDACRDTTQFSDKNPR